MMITASGGQSTLSAGLEVCRVYRSVLVVPGDKHLAAVGGLRYVFEVVRKALQSGRSERRATEG
jgi:hypothetical protein